MYYSVIYLLGNSALLRRRLALRASRELLDPYIRPMSVPKALAGHRALSLKTLILTAKSPENTRKMAPLPEACQCARLFTRRYRFWSCCARLATGYGLKLSLGVSLSTVRSSTRTTTIYR